jgi:hypothetical protein
MILAYGRPYRSPYFYERVARLFGAHWFHDIDSDEATNPMVVACGKSGTGKSGAQLFHFEQALAKRMSCIEIDPHGKGARDCLRVLIRAGYDPRDVLIIDPGNPQLSQHSPQLALLELGPNEQPFEPVGRVVSAFKAIAKDGLMDRGLDILRQCCFTCIDAGLSIADIPLLLTDEAFRAAAVARVRSADVRAFWGQFARFRAEQFANFVESVRNKISAFLANTYIRNLLSATTSTFDFYDLMRTGKAAIIRFSEATFDPTTRRLAMALIMEKIKQAVMRRHDDPESACYPTAIFVDEVHEVWHSDAIMPLLGSGRKLQTALHLYFHTLDQLDPIEAQVLLGTASNLLAFASSRRTAEFMAKEMVSVSGTRVKYQERTFWGPKGRPQFYSTTEEFEHVIAQIMRQERQQCFAYSIARNGRSIPYFGSIPIIDYPKENPIAEARFAEASARHYGRTIADINRAEAERRAALFRPPRVRVVMRTPAPVPAAIADATDEVYEPTNEDFAQHWPAPAV